MARELFGKTHIGKDGAFVDNAAQETLEQYNQKYGEADSLDVASGNVSRSYSRWVEHVGVKNGRTYGTVVDDHIIQNMDTEESFTNTSRNEELNQLRETLELQQIEQGIIRAELENMRAIQEAQTQKLDQVVESQSSIQQNLRNIVTQEVQRSIVHEVSKVVAHEMGKATRQLLDAIRSRP